MRFSTTTSDSVLLVFVVIPYTCNCSYNFTRVYS